MIAAHPTYLGVNLPEEAVWFCLGLMLALAIAIFFKFSRLLSMRNLDVVTLFLLVPGFLLLRAGALSGRSGPDNLSRFGYLWLVCGSLYFLVRCLADLALVRRPALAPNLNLGGLSWLAGTLLVCLIIFSYQQPGSTEVGFAQRVEDVVGRGADQVGVTPAQPGINTGSFALAILCHIAIVTGLIIIGWRHFQDLHAGVAAATLYLLLPYYQLVPYAGLPVWLHAWPAALIIWAVAAYRTPSIAGLLLGLAAGTVFFPLVVFPVFLSFYWKRGAGRFAGAFALSAGACLAVIITAALLNRELWERMQSELALADWQPWRIPQAHGLWQQVHWAYRIPVFIGYLAFVIATAFWPFPKNLAHVLALTAAALIGIQFWYADRGGAHVLWYLPLFLLVVFRPNLSDRRPLMIDSERDWLWRVGRWLFRRAQKLLQPAPPMVNVK